MLPLALAAAAALLLLGGSKASARAPARPKLPAPAPKLVPAPKGIVTVGPVTIVKTAPKTATKTTAKTTKLQPKKVAAPKPKAPSVTQSRTMQAPLAAPASQEGASSPLASALSADIPSDTFSPAAPRPDTTPRSQPSGYNPDAARRGASSLSNHLRRAGKAKYDRPLLRQFQTNAGLKADGLYGPATRGALVYFGAKDPPAPFSGSGTIPYKPPV